MDAKRSFLNQHSPGILVLLVLLVFVVLVFSCGCTQSGIKTPGINESAAGASVLTETVKCGGAGEACCENNSCSYSDLVCIEDKCINFKLNISTDKELYKSNENANVTLIIYSSSELNNMVFKVYGINSRSGYQLNTARTVNLTSGRNVNSISFTLPSCNRCAGINPGTYKIYADLFYNGTVVSNASKDIELQQ